MAPGFEEYRQALDGASLYTKEAILNRAAMDPDISAQEFIWLRDLAYPFDTA